MIPNPAAANLGRNVTVGDPVTSYVMQEGTLPLQPIEDRTVNILTLGRPEGVPVHLVISRDALLPGEDLAASVARQLRTLSRQVQAFKQIQQKEVSIGADQLAALLVQTQFKQSGQNIYQLQAMVRLPSGKLLIFTLNSAMPIDDSLHSLWSDILAGFVPSMRDTTPPQSTSP